MKRTFAALTAAALTAGAAAAAFAAGSSSLGVIGGADGPTAVFVASENGKTASDHDKIFELRRLKEAAENAASAADKDEILAQISALVASWEEAAPAATAMDTAEELEDLTEDAADGGSALESTLEFEPAAEIGL